MSRSLGESRPDAERHRLDDAKTFYGWLMPRLGTPNRMDYPETYSKRGAGFFGDAIPVRIQAGEPHWRAGSFHRHRVRLCEIVFGADNRPQFDELAREIEAHGGKVTDAPREHDYHPGYYTAFFTDPDGFKFALVHLPR